MGALRWLPGEEEAPLGGVGREPLGLSPLGLLSDVPMRARRTAEAGRGPAGGGWARMREPLAASAAAASALGEDTVAAGADARGGVALATLVAEPARCQANIVASAWMSRKRTPVAGSSSPGDGLRSGVRDEGTGPRVAEPDASCWPPLPCLEDETGSGSRALASRCSCSSAAAMAAPYRSTGNRDAAAPLAGSHSANWGRAESLAGSVAGGLAGEEATGAPAPGECEASRGSAGGFFLASSSDDPLAPATERGAVGAGAASSFSWCGASATGKAGGSCFLGLAAARPLAPPSSDPGMPVPRRGAFLGGIVGMEREARMGCCDGSPSPGAMLEPAAGTPGVGLLALLAASVLECVRVAGSFAAVGDGLSGRDGELAAVGEASLVEAGAALAVLLVVGAASGAAGSRGAAASGSGEAPVSSFAFAGGVGWAGWEPGVPACAEESARPAAEASGSAAEAGRSCGSSSALGVEPGLLPGGRGGGLGALGVRRGGGRGAMERLEGLRGPMAPGLGLVGPDDGGCFESVASAAPACLAGGLPPAKGTLGLGLPDALAAPGLAFCGEAAPSDPAGLG